MQAFARFAVVGGFTTERRKARGDGLRVFRIDGSSGAWTPASHLSGVVNPSFIVPGPQTEVLYAAHGDCDYASAYKIDRETGELRLLSEAPTGGTNGVHLALDPSGKFLVVANYASGSVGVLPIGPDGSLEPFTCLIELPGQPGPHRAEQASSHPHQVVFDPPGRFLLVPDKGLDRVFVLAFDASTGDLRLKDRGHAVMRPGAGPRHLAFHPSLPLAFAVNEIDSTVAVCSWDAVAGALKPFEVRSTLPPGFFGASTAAAIAVSPCGRHVYATNRGHDGIAHFTFDARANRLDTAGWIPSRGRDPRFMCFDPGGRVLIVANEQSDRIVFFDADQETGALAPRDLTVSVASPSTIAFV